MMAKNGIPRASMVIWLVVVCNASDHGVIAQASPTEEKDQNKESEEPAQIGLLKIPANVVVPKDFKPILSALLKRSATFRYQCERISEAVHVRIEIRLVTHLVANRCRAISRVVKSEGQILITMQIIVLSNYVEVIGHEFEHALEQVEGIDLKDLSVRKNRQVYRLEDGSFETSRAIRIGRIVEKEYFDSQQEK